ncbi:MAG: hypothetical protein ACYCO3_05965 [Mycobacteriales bacterium]
MPCGLAAWVGLPQDERAAAETAAPCAPGLADGDGVAWATEET